VFSGAIGQWKYIQIPVGGGLGWVRSVTGTVSEEEISFMQIHADTWGAGYTVWIDGLQFMQVSGVSDNAATLPRCFRLFQNYPNPFNAGTVIRFEVPRAVAVSLRIFDLLGRTVATLAGGTMQPGSYAVTWTAGGLPSGAYYYRLASGDFVESRKLLILK
jgi:hypothetical protein